MNDDMWDEVPAPHLEDELWPTLEQAHAAQRWATGSPTPQLSRQRGRRLVLVGAAAIATAASLLVAAVVTGGDGGETTTDSTTSNPDDAQPVELNLAAKITAATEEASASSIVHTMQDMLTGPGDSEMWSDEQSGAFRSLSFDEDGEPSFDSGPAVAPTVDDAGPEVPDVPTADLNPASPAWPKAVIRQVDYCFAEYEEIEQPALPGRNEADLVGERLADGSLVEDGTELVDGRELIRLVEVPVSQLPQTTPPETTSTQPSPTTTGLPSTQPSPTTTTVSRPPPTTPDQIDWDLVEHVFFVDPETNRPVRVVGYPGSDAEYVMTIDYLPRTPEILALLSPPIPDDFVQADLRSDGERYDRCG